MKKMRMLKVVTALVLAFTLILAGCSSDDSTDTTTDTDTGTDTAQTDTATDDTDVDTDTEEDSDEGDVEGTLPRDETLYFAGLQWGAINGWNPLSDDMNNALLITQTAAGTRVPMFETLYMFNFLDGSMQPLLADGDFEWNADRTSVTVKLKDAAKWSDGTPITAEDVVYTFDTIVKIGNGQGNSLKPYIESVEAQDDKTIVVNAKLTDDGIAENTLMVEQYLSTTYVLQKAWIETVEARTGGDPVAMKQDPGEDVVYSGAYGPYFANDQRVVVVRNEDYWGQDASMWGSLPQPTYLAHTIYVDNAAGEVAFKAGEVDVCQQFIPNIQDLWLKDNLPISTYLEEEPYGITGQLPTAWYNLDVPALQNVAVRKAIALAVDYDAIISNAMTNQSPTFDAVPRSVMNPTEAEQSMYRQEDVADLQWAGNDIDGANALLDEAGIVDTDGDGIRELDGENLSFNATCPNGWTDWMAAIEMVAAAGEKIGIEITSEFPEWSVYQTVITAASQDQYDIFMMWTDGSAPTQPWARVRQLMSSEYNGIEGNWSGNWGHYSNDRVDEIISAIPKETDMDVLQDLYTEAVEIYLTEVPSFTLMYRPNNFHAVNESVWTGYPEAGDGKNVPPNIMVDGYSIAGLYDLSLVQ